MSVEIVLPKLSDTMEEGTVLKWLKREGDAVRQGEVIAEVETDKADMELEASDAGVLGAIKVQAGESVPVGTVLAVLETDGAVRAPQAIADGGRAGGAAEPAARDDETASAAEGGEAAARAEKRPAGGGEDDEPVPAAAGAAKKPVEVRRPADAKTGAAKPAAPVAARPRPAAAPAARAEVKASPEARAAAEAAGIDLARVRGSGPGGRIVQEDVQAALAPDGGGRSAARRADADLPAPRAETPAVSERHELSRMRQSIARRMAEAFREIPHFYVTAEIDMTEAVRLKEALQRSALFDDAPVTYTHMVLKATARALRRHPRLNASFHDGAIELKGDVNIGMAVAVEDGLIVPVLRHVDDLPLADIAREARRLGEQAKQGRFGGSDLSGGTFTVSNMGMLDIEHFTAVINPPQAAILAVGAIKERPVVRGGALAVARTMHVTVSCDHRVIDGVMAGRFLEELKGLLENPIVLVLRDR